MVDTPKETNGDEAMEENPSKKKAKHGRRQRRSKPHHNTAGTTVKNNPDGAEDEYNPDQPTFEQAGLEADGYLERDNYMPPSEDELSLDDDEFSMPKDPAEQVRFKRRLMATARSLQKKQQQLKADQDLLMDKWTKVLAIEKYILDRPHKGHTRHNCLPQPKQENPRHIPRRQHITTVQDNTKDTRRGILKPRCNGHKRQVREAGAKSSNSQSGQRTKNSSSLYGPSNILDQPCEIHGTPRRTAKHTNRERRILKTKRLVVHRK